MIPSQNKKGQVTIFLIIGIILLVLSSLFYFLISTLQETSIEDQVTESTSLISTELALRGFVESCLDEITNEAIILSAYGGGTIYPEEDSLILLTDFNFYTYSSLDGINGIEETKVEQDISTYVEKYLTECTSDFETFTEQGFVIEQSEEISATTKLNEGEVEIDVTFPLTIKSPSGDVLEIQDFSTTVETSYLEMLGQAQEIAQNYDSFFSLGSQVSDYTLTIFPFDDTTTIFSLVDEETLIGDAPLVLFFAVGNTNLQYEPILDFIPDITLREGGQWEYYLSASDVNQEKIYFSSDSSDFPISENGGINVTVPAKGTYRPTFTVTDESGLEDSQKITITVLEDYGVEE